VLLAGAVPLFLGALLADMAYCRSYEIQWINFAAWLIVGGMVFTALALLWALVDLVRERSRGRALVYFLVLLAVFVSGLVNSFVHAQDAWATMPEAAVLSVVVTALAAIATWIGFSGVNRLRGSDEGR
jgi:uncharacterized membrane protein